MRYGALFLAAILACAAVSCEKKNPDAFFHAGKKVSSGLIWQKSPVTVGDILKGKKVTKLYEDSFERPELGAAWTVQGEPGTWRIEKESAYSETAHNRNLVLKGIELPENALIELTLRSETPTVDIKFNAWGDGGIHDHGDGYSFILGGWHNQISVVSRLDEHEKNRSEERATRLSPAKNYRATVIRIGGKIWWFLDDEIFLAYLDPQPLSPAAGYRYLSFGDWESKVFFDDLKISKIEE